MSCTTEAPGWESLAKAVRVQSEMKVDLLECEELLTKRKFQSALDSASAHIATLSSSALETGGIRERTVCVGIQALFELGRSEDAFAFATNAYAPCQGSLEFVPPGILKLLFKLRLHLDDGDSKRAAELLQPYISLITNTKQVLEASSGPAVHVDEEALELFLLDCVYPQDGREAVETFLRDAANALPAQSHAGLTAGINSFFAELEAQEKAAAAAAAEQSAPAQLTKAVPDLDSSSRNPDSSDLLSPRKPNPPPAQAENQAARGTAGPAGEAQVQTVVSRGVSHGPVPSPPSPSVAKLEVQARQRRLLLWAMGLGGGLSWLLLVVYAARRGRLRVLQALFASWRQAPHLWGPLLGAFAFFFAFVIVVL